MAVRYRFTRDWDYSVRYGVDVAYRAGSEVLIPDAHADAADNAGAGERLPAETSEEAKDADER